MKVLGLSETVEDVQLWAVCGVPACVDLRFDCPSRDRSSVGAVIDTALEPSLNVWDQALERYRPEWRFGPVCYDVGELGSYYERTQRFSGVRDISPILRAGSDSALDAIRHLNLSEIALDGRSVNGGWNHWLLEGVDVWLVGGVTPRDQWLTWLELNHRGVAVRGIVLDPPSWHDGQKLSPSNLSPLEDKENLGRWGAVNVRTMSAHWGAELPELRGYRSHPVKR